MAIYSDRKFFKSKLTTIRGPRFACSVSTTRDGLFGPHSTGIYPAAFRQDGTADELPLVPIVKLHYQPQASKDDRLIAHDGFCYALNMLADQGDDFLTALRGAGDLVIATGHVFQIEVVNNLDDILTTLGLNW